MKAGLERFRICQIMDGLYKSKAREFKNITTLSKEIKALLQEQTEFFTIQREDTRISYDKKTVKFLYKLPDGPKIESVLLPNSKKKYTLCVSTQAGCALGCAFCASGLLGCERNLTVSEIIEQVMDAQKEGKEITNIVFMGTGEPLLNISNLDKAIRILNHEELYRLGTRKITVSTAGVIKGIKEFTQMQGQVRLSVSLHFPYNEMRDKYMPVNHTNPLPELLACLKEYQDQTGRLITFEYILFRNLNDNLQVAHDMRKLLKDIDYKINLIPYNEVSGLPFRTPDPLKVRKFYNHLKKKGVKCTLRVRRGDDINGACGQLRLKARKKTEKAEN